MEVVGGIGGDVGGQTGYKVPGLLRTAGKGNGCAKRAAQDATDVNLRSRGAGQLVVAVATVQMPFRAEVVVNTDNGEVIALGDGDIGFKALLVNAVASATSKSTCDGGPGAAGVVSRRHQGPQLLNGGINSNPSGIQALCVVICSIESENSGAHVCARNGPFDGRRVLPAEALIVEKEVGLAAKNRLRNDGTADSAPKTVVMEAGDRSSGSIVVPGVSIESVVQIIFVSGAVPSVGAALGDHLDLRTGGIVEVRGLVSRVDFEFFDAVGGSGHHTCWDTARIAATAKTGAGRDSRGIAAEARRIDLHAAIHVVGVVAAIEHEGALIDHGAGHAAVRGYTRLQSNEGADIATD